MEKNFMEKQNVKFLFNLIVNFRILNLCSNIIKFFFIISIKKCFNF